MPKYYLYVEQPKKIKLHLKKIALLIKGYLLSDIS